MKRGIKNFWTHESCKKESLKYTTRNQFALSAPSAYNKSWKNGWLGEFYPNTPVTKPKNYWNYETCKEEASKYKNRSEFMIKSVGASSVARKNNWLTIFYPNDKPIMVKKFKNYWDYNTCKEEASKHQNKRDFRILSIGAYNMSWKNKWLDEFYPNEKIIPRKYPNRHWDYENCKELSLKCKNRTEYIEHSKTAYLNALKNNWLDEFYPNEKKRKPRNYWNYETCKERATKYETRNQFQKNESRAYNVSWRNGWIEEFFPKSN